MKKLNNNGFGALHALLVVIIFGLICGTGWYVYSQQKQTNTTQTDTTKPTTTTKQSTTTTTTKTQSEEDSWLLFETNYYTVRVPDGWKLESQDDNLVGFTNNIVYAKGTKAYVDTTVTGGKDGPVPFALWYPKQNYDQIVKEGDFIGNIKTNDGLTVAKYKYVQTTDQEAIGYQKGDTAINYYFGGDGKYIQITHYYPPGGTDQSAYVDKLIKTVKIK